MAETYCGKSCEQCSHKVPMNCPGCKDGPGKFITGDCELAKCARTKGHATCQSCGLRGNCGNYRNSYHFPEYRRRKQESEALKKVTMARRANLLGKCLWILFWLIIPNTVASMMADEKVGQLVPGLYVLGLILQILCSVVYGLVLLKAGSEESRYRTAGICALVCGGCSVLTAAIPAVSESAGWTLLLAIPVLVAGMIREYNEFMGHAAVLEELDDDLSEKWEVLWKWYIGLFLGLFGCIIVALLSPFLGTLSLLGIAIGILVVMILKLVYLFRTAKVFREYSATDSN